MSDPLLIKDNELSLLDSGVWVKSADGQSSHIDYSDGDNSENAVYSKLESASDRSVFSPELDRPWGEWALEYHLSSKRSNLYRGLNLEGVNSVLEVGCGCGAITRFFGEMGCRVDAIEGTLRRAQIARMRTRELDNVQIVSSNYHALALPEDTYDLVVFTGVLEYSGAYAADGMGPEAQLEATLRSARAALNANGRVLIAIENRIGFKYLAGATEDHLNHRNIGLLGYPEPVSGNITRGIRTWSRREWQNLLASSGFEAWEFCYPFPDYKVPDAILSDNFVNSVRYPDQVLGGVFSRDYSRTWWPELSESLFWRTAAEADSLGSYANSFLIVAGDAQEPVRNTVDLDFVRFASVRRKLPYRMQVCKKRGEDKVERMPLLASPDREQGLVRQVHIQGEAFVDGQVLEQIWFQALTVVSSYDELSGHIKAYGAWLRDQLSQGAEPYVDALPQNIIVDSDGNWHLIDQEWYAAEGASIEVIVFRALLNFALNAREALADMELNAFHQTAGGNNPGMQTPLVQCLDDFIEWGFSELGLSYASQREHCIAFESVLHSQVSISEYHLDLNDLLATPIYQWHNGQSFQSPPTPMMVRAFWTQIDGIWHPDHSVTVEANFEHGLNVELDMPLALLTHRFLRVDPSANVLNMYRGWLEFRGLSVSVTRGSGEQERVYDLQGAAQLFERGKVRGMRLVSGERILLTSPEASFVLDLHAVDWGENVESILLRLVIDSTSDKDVVGRRTLLREESVRVAYRLQLREHMLNRQQERLDEASRRMAVFHEKLGEGSRTWKGRFLAKFGLMRKYDI